MHATATAGLSPVAAFVADAPVLTYPFLLIGLWLVGRFQDKPQLKVAALTSFFAVIFAAVCSLALQALFPAERPEGAMSNAGNLLLSVIPTASFPSDHSAAAFAFAVGLIGSRLLRTGWAYVAIGAAMALSRVAIGVHFFSDVIAGALLGALVAFVITRRTPAAFLFRVLYAPLIRFASFFRL